MNPTLASTRSIHAGFRAWTRNQSHLNRWLFSFLGGFSCHHVDFRPIFPTATVGHIDLQMVVSLSTARVLVIQYLAFKITVNGVVVRGMLVHGVPLLAELTLSN
ncbi:hypothetical protein [Collimonas sp.]|uniref:hypothetical protein n=1 Tax=Collimonas sp. TaxID=1963772 RepID=UPI002B8CED40|nr:hypothetical protein [Collimonas sp.]HWX04159.1 hypothetical protein [Collimonas sp.]